VGRVIIGDAGDVRAVGREDPPGGILGGDGGASGAGTVALGVDGTEPGLQVEAAAGGIGVVDVPLVVELFITAASAAAAKVFPMSGIVHINKTPR
jgi:hypothetical protein